VWTRGSSSRDMRVPGSASYGLSVGGGGRWKVESGRSEVIGAGRMG
jgi:hypothetical protein